MERRLKNYLEFLRGTDYGHFSKEDIELMRKECLVQIRFFQHERLIHLIITVVFALMVMLSIIAGFVSNSIAFVVLTCLLIVLLIPYLRYYIVIENGVQTIYAYYDQMASAASGELRVVPKELYSKPKK